MVKNVFNKKDIDIKIEYQLLLIAEELDSNYNLIYRILDCINWPSGKKGYDYFITFKNFSLKLKKLVFKKSLSLSDAYFFHKNFLKNYDPLLKLLPAKLTFSECNNVIRNISVIRTCNSTILKQDNY